MSKKNFIFLTSLLSFGMAILSAESPSHKSLYSIPLVSIKGEKTDLSVYKDNILLIVNTASKCGLTKQYKGLESLWNAYSDKGLVVLGFPCNQFGGQEPYSEEKIMAFCQAKYDVSFPMFSKIEVNGEGTHPLYAHLKEKAPGILGTGAIKWNFTKFLVKPGAEEIVRFSPKTKPKELTEKIDSWLAPKKN